MINNVFGGIMFDDKHSYRDYGLYLNKPPDFGSPTPKLSYVDVPGRDGALDFTEAATGEVKYNNRRMTFSFVAEVRRERRETLRDRLNNDLHGKKVEIIYDFDPDWYYVGRCSVAFSDVIDWKMKVIVTVDAEPYKLARDLDILVVEPTSFSAETILLGKGTAAQHVNSIFIFGTAYAPQLDLTQFSKLSFRWSDNTPWGTPTLQIVDGDGSVFNMPLQATIIGSGFYGMDLNVSDITNIAKARVYRILCQGRSMVELSATTTASASITAIVDRMSVVPIWTASTAVTVLINGRKFAVPSGASRNYNMRMREGENQLSFIVDSDNATIEVQYQNGRL